jgi:hypothetical protein
MSVQYRSCKKKCSQLVLCEAILRGPMGHASQSSLECECRQADQSEPKAVVRQSSLVEVWCKSLHNNTKLAVSQLLASKDMNTEAEGSDYQTTDEDA